MYIYEQCYPISLTPLVKFSLVHAQVLSSTVLLKHFDLIPRVGQVIGETYRFAKVNHVHTHSALVNRAPQHWSVLDGEKMTIYSQFLNL